jgi:hypothetical protein
VRNQCTEHVLRIGYHHSISEVNGPMGGEWEPSIDVMNQISIYELDVEWYGGGGIS